MVEYVLPVGKDVRPPSSGGTQWTLANTDLPITATASQQRFVVDAIRHISLAQYHRAFPTATSSVPHSLGALPPLCDSYLPPPASHPTVQRPLHSPRGTSLQRARNHFKLTSSHELLKFSLTDGTVEGNGLHCNSIIGCQYEMLRLYQTLVNGRQCPVSRTDIEKGRLQGGSFCACAWFDLLIFDLCWSR